MRPQRQLAAPRRCARSAPRISAQASKTPEPVAPPSLMRPKPASAAKQAQAQPAATLVTESYKKAADAIASGETVEVKVVGQNTKGLMVQFGAVRGFMPFTAVDAARLRQCQGGDMSPLMETVLRVRIMSADPARKELVCSERQALASEALAQMETGGVVTGVVTAVEDYGAFVQVAGMPDVSCMVHKSEVSWDRILTVDQVLQPGQEIRAKVISVDPVNVRVGLSVKQLSTDPLRASLDSLAWEPSAVSPEPQVEALIEQLRSSPGVDGVEVKQSAQDPHHVAQDLEVYLVRTDSEGVYTCIARLGVVATQLSLTAKELSREQVKLMLQRVAQKL
ncbi:hypothetical protein HYH03_011489 [Edaphochlamys debaryana]|uniref:S1 motif domain-containing protein n=1 Tax=Edaphochlamys debaryana TaxID=47281 RepID=A0A835Y2S3_9CHLO|nr:hypothetical protein HYH03_011489 [Edaphochlamys debaryana]|eukprot:KAG2490024.1 hypothetical protein HYH03_011489 [Edaphochlamys debaryana]